MSMQVEARRIPEWKIREVEELAGLLRRYKVFAIASLENLPTKQLQIIKKRLRGRIHFKVTKNTLMERALRKAGIQGYEQLLQYLTGPNIFLFTDLNPFELARLLEKEKVSIPAKAGMIADKEIVVPEGNTGIPPGPMMSVFGRLKIPTKMQGGTIWIARDTVVARPGDTISPELASLLLKLGIEPFEVGLKLKAAWEEGLVYPAEKLKIDVEELRSQVIEAHLNALKIGVEIGYPEPEVLKLSVAKAYQAALAVAAEAGYVTPETVEAVLARAQASAWAIVAALGDKAGELGIEAPATISAEKEESEEKRGEEEEEKEEEASEEDIAAGLGALFG